MHVCMFFYACIQILKAVHIYAHFSFLLYCQLVTLAVNVSLATMEVTLRFNSYNACPRITVFCTMITRVCTMT